MKTKLFLIGMLMISSVNAEEISKDQYTESINLARAYLSIEYEIPSCEVFIEKFTSLYNNDKQIDLKEYVNYIRDQDKCFTDIGNYANELIKRNKK